ncbi:hypothetical protein KQI88_17600 [Alkaliphilus sp. MSJ-5]|uniref:Uncharacterized protein n=1 Tax=Alkaliphilus flagellatus TaxID=2841507 RepID=A0ABS6G934_9FIRM|nr:MULTISPECIES: hypothetical protein [Alkaliphilus]MBU5678227.1 hypothetical protein [Alkaliphilus flagellatus]QUH19367.1 hypothetical protein HYG84_05320 [Alkaliphilus sp. B6464]
MGGEFNYPIIDNFRMLYDEGYRCINYEIDKKDDQFTVYLKNFEKENTKTLKCNPKDGMVLKNYIDRMS